MELKGLTILETFRDIPYPWSISRFHVEKNAPRLSTRQLNVQRQELRNDGTLVPVSAYQLPGQNDVVHEEDPAMDQHGAEMAAVYWKKADVRL